MKRFLLKMLRKQKSEFFNLLNVYNFLLLKDCTEFNNYSNKEIT